MIVIHPRKYRGPVVDESLNYSGFQAALKLTKVDITLIGPGKWDGFIAHGLTAFVGPWGASFAANLTPDNATGIGKWTENTFINAMRNDKHAGAGQTDFTSDALAECS